MAILDKVVTTVVNNPAAVAGGGGATAIAGVALGTGVSSVSGGGTIGDRIGSLSLASEIDDDVWGYNVHILRKLKASTENSLDLEEGLHRIASFKSDSRMSWFEKSIEGLRRWCIVTYEEPFSSNMDVLYRNAMVLCRRPTFLELMRLRGTVIMDMSDKEDMKAAYREKLKILTREKDWRMTPIMKNLKNSTSPLVVDSTSTDELEMICSSRMGNLVNSGRTKEFYEVLKYCTNESLNYHFLNF